MASYTHNNPAYPKINLAQIQILYRNEHVGYLFSQFASTFVNIVVLHQTTLHSRFSSFISAHAVYDSKSSSIAYFASDLIFKSRFREMPFIEESMHASFLSSISSHVVHRHDENRLSVLMFTTFKTIYKQDIRVDFNKYENPFKFSVCFSG